MLKENQHGKFVECFWQAKPFTPSGIIRVSEKKEEWKNRKNKEKKGESKLWQRQQCNI